jgi:hypothetical protein
MDKMQFIRIFLLSQLLFFANTSAKAASIFVYQSSIDQHVNKRAELENITLTISDKNLVISTISKSTQSSNATLMSIVGQNMGEWKLDWDASGKQIKKLEITDVPSGIYIFTIRTGDHTVSRKIII